MLVLWPRSRTMEKYFPPSPYLMISSRTFKLSLGNLGTFSFSGAAAIFESENKQQLNFRRFCTTQSIKKLSCSYLTTLLLLLLLLTSKKKHILRPNNFLIMIKSDIFYHNHFPYDTIYNFTSEMNTLNTLNVTARLVLSPTLPTFGTA